MARRSGRAQLRHPAPQVRGSPSGTHSARSASRWGRGYTAWEHRVSAVLPPNESRTRRPLPSTGSPGGEFPRFHGTMGRSDSLRTLPPPFVFLRLAVPSRAPVFVSPVRSDADPRAWSFRGGQLRALLYRDGAAGSPKFLGNPPESLPCS